MTIAELSSYCNYAANRKELVTCSTVYTDSDVMVNTYDHDEDLIIVLTTEVKNIGMFKRVSPETVPGSVNQKLYELALESLDVLQDLDFEGRNFWLTGWGFGGSLSVVLASLLESSDSYPNSSVAFFSNDPGDREFMQNRVSPVYTVSNGIWRPKYKNVTNVKAGNIFNSFSKPVNSGILESIQLEV